MQVREKWWRKHCAEPPQLTETELEVFENNSIGPVESYCCWKRTVIITINRWGCWER